MKKLKPPVPADRKQCQGEKSNGVNFMTLGGRHEMIRCTDKPTVVATEKKPGKDGRVGEMSLCTGCHVQFLKQMPDGFASFEEITDG